MAECIVVVDGDVGDADVASMLSRLRRLAPCRPLTLPRANTATRLNVLADGVGGATAPVFMVDGRYVGHDSPLVDVLGAPGPASAVLQGIEGLAWPATVSDGVVRSSGSDMHTVAAPNARVGGALRIAVDDCEQAAQAIRDMAKVVGQRGWSDPDLLPFVLVAMTRSGIRVRTVPVRDFVAAVPTTEQQRLDAEARLKASDEHRLRLNGAAREADGFYSTFVIRRVSRAATAVALKLRVTPNQVTLASLAIAIIAMGAFSIGSRGWLIAGAALLQLSLVVDCVDGELARYTRMHSPLGAWLDAVTDRFKEFGIYAALAVGASRGGDSVWLLAGSALALQVARHFVDFGFALRQADRIRSLTEPVMLPLDVPADDYEAPPDAAPPGRAAGWGHAATALSERTNKVGALVWVKRVIIMPIGERWLVLSLGAALSGPRLALTLLLALGTIAALYTTAGRVLRSAATSALVSTPRTAAGLKALTDPGLSSGLLREGALLGRLGWLVPAIARAIEYGATLVAVSFVARAWLPLTFAYLFVLAMWHYDAVYRLRFTGQAPPLSAQRAALGAVVRPALVVTAATTIAAALPQVVAAMGLLVLIVTAVDSTKAWRRWLSARKATFTVHRFDVEVAA